MKNLILILGLTVSTLVSYSQKLVVTLDTTMEMNWPLNMSLIEAFNSNLVEYNKAYAGYTTYSFDLKCKKLSLLGVIGITREFKISKFEENNVGYHIEILYGKYVAKFVITKKDSINSTLFCVFDFEDGDIRANGYYSNKVNIIHTK